MQPPPHPERGSSYLRVLSHPFRWVWRAGRYLEGGCLGGYPERELYPTEHHRRKAMRRAAFKVIGRPRWIVAAAAAVGLSLVLTLVLRRALGSLGLPISQTTLNLILAFPVTIGCALFGVWILSRQYSKLLRQELLDCGVPICVHCGYHLIGMPGPNCPECGRPFDEHVRRILKLDTSPPAPK